MPPAGRLRAPPAIGLLMANVAAVRRPEMRQAVRDHPKPAVRDHAEPTGPTRAVPEAARTGGRGLGQRRGQVARARVRTEIRNHAGVLRRARLARPPATEHLARDRSAAAHGTVSDQATNLPGLRTALTGQTVRLIVGAQSAEVAPEAVRRPIRIAPAGPTVLGAVPNREHLPQRRAGDSKTPSDRRHGRRSVRQP